MVDIMDAPLALPVEDMVEDIPKRRDNSITKALRGMSSQSWCKY